MEQYSLHSIQYSEIVIFFQLLLDYTEKHCRKYTHTKERKKKRKEKKLENLFPSAHNNKVFCVLRLNSCYFPVTGDILRKTKKKNI